MPLPPLSTSWLLPIHPQLKPTTQSKPLSFQHSSSGSVFCLWTPCLLKKTALYTVLLSTINSMCVCVCMHAQSCLTLCNPMETAPRQVPLSMGFSQQEDWKALPFPPPGDLPKPGDQTHVSGVSCIHRQIFYLWATREARNIYHSTEHKPGSTSKLD